jgi:hypothetical protein
VKGPQTRWTTRCIEYDSLVIREESRTDEAPGDLGIVAACFAAVGSPQWFRWIVSKSRSKLTGRS